MSHNIEDMKKLEQLRSLQSQRKLAELQVEEQTLRRQLKTLNEHRRISHSTDLGLVPMRAIGADILWQSWIDRTQAELNIQLAKLLVRKEPVARKARRDSSRNEVVGMLGKEMRIAENKKRVKNSLANMLETATSNGAILKSLNGLSQDTEGN